MKKTDYWEEVQSNLGSASTQAEYNGLLSFENRDLEIREFKNQCMSLLREELSRHPDLIPKCLLRDPDEAIISFFDSQREVIEGEFEDPDGDRNAININAPCIDGLEIDILDKMADDLHKNGGSSYYFLKFLVARILL